MTLQILSQRDPKWSGITLGTKGTIGEYGCTITSLAMASSLTPDLVNERLNRVGGYANGNLIIWSKIKEAIPWMEFEWRGYAYDNSKVLSAIQKNGFCLVEVDGSRIGGTKHWVLYIGGGQMYDPWYGTQKATSYYAPLGYAVINKIAEPESTMYRGYDLSNSESMKVCVDDHLKIVEGQLVPKGELDEANRKLSVAQGRITELETQNSSLSSDLGVKTSDLKEALESAKTAKEALARELNDQLDWAKVAEDEQEKHKITRDRLDDLIYECEEELKLSHGSDDVSTKISKVLGTLHSQLEAKQIQLKVSDYKLLLVMKGHIWLESK